MAGALYVIVKLYSFLSMRSILVNTLALLVVANSNTKPLLAFIFCTLCYLFCIVFVCDH
jgi:hypothetical protein